MLSVIKPIFLYMDQWVLDKNGRIFLSDSTNTRHEGYIENNFFFENNWEKVEFSLLMHEINVLTD